MRKMIRHIDEEYSEKRIREKKEMKRFETEISMTLKMTVYVIAHDRADAERKISRVTRNNGEDPDNDFLEMVESFQDQFKNELFGKSIISKNDDYEVGAEIVGEDWLDEMDVTEDKRMIPEIYGKKGSILKITPYGDPKFISKTDADEIVRVSGLCRFVQKTGAIAVCDIRHVIRINGIDYSVGPVYIFGPDLHLASPHRAQATADYIEENRVVLNADGKDLPAFRMTFGKGSER